MTAFPRVVVVLTILATGTFLGAQATINPKTLTQDQLFQRTKVWTAHLTFTPEQWKGLEPSPVPPNPNRQGSGGEWLQGNAGLRNGWRTSQMGYEFNYVHATLELGGVVFKDVAVRYKGSATYSPRSIQAVKNSYKVDLNKYVKGQKLTGVSTLNFHNMITDAGWMNEVLAYRLYRDAGVPASRTAYIRMHVTVPGLYDKRYTGLYLLTENVDSNFIGARFPSDEGAILKPVSVNLFNDLGNDWATYNQTYDPKTDLTDAEKARIIEFCQFVTKASDADFNARINTYLDFDQFARYFAVVAWINNWDSILDRGQNFYMFLDPRTKRFVFIPWDQDHSFGAFGAQPPDSHTTGNIYHPWITRTRLLERIMALPAFRSLYVAKMKEFSTTIFMPERFKAQVGELAPLLRKELADEPVKNPGVRLLAGPTLPTFERIAAGQVGLLPFTVERSQDVLAQLARPQ